MSTDHSQTRREQYPWRLTIQTRWGDNDQFNHLNNVCHIRFFELLITQMWMVKNRVNLPDAPVRIFTAEVLCRYHNALSFPQVVDGGLRVAHLGSSSMRYEMALFAPGDEAPAATGHRVDVCVDKQHSRPMPIPDEYRAMLAALQQ